MLKVLLKKKYYVFVCGVFVFVGLEGTEVYFWTGLTIWPVGRLVDWSVGQLSGLLVLLFLLTKTSCHLAKVELLANYPLVNVQDVQARALEMSRGIVGLGNEDTAALAVIGWLVQIANCDELLLNWAQQVETWLDFGVWVIRFNSRAHDGQEPAIGGDLVSVRDATNVDI